MQQQNQNVQVEEGISLMDIIKLLLSKILILILVAIIGGVAGGLFAIWRTVDINYFGTRIEFYVNPEKPEESEGSSSGTAAGGSQYGVYGAYGRHVMDNMVKLLSSDIFAEQLLLNGKSLPEKDYWIGAEETIWVGDEEKNLNTLLNDAIDAAQEPLNAVTDAQTDYDAALAAKATAVKAYTAAEESLNSVWRQELFQKGLANKASFNEEEYFSLAKLGSIPEEVTNAYDSFISAQNEVTRKAAKANDTEEVWKNAQKYANEYVETALEYWRSSAKYASVLSFYKSAISYSYLESDEDFEDANNLARSFIYVSISVQHSNYDEGMRIANNLSTCVKKVVPQYVSDNMTVPDGYSGTNCRRITTSTDGVRLTNPGYTTKKAITYGILGAVAAFIVAAVIIIILDKSDKRLRDTEVIARKFNVPLLGVVPTIEDLKVEQPAKKKADKTVEVK